MSDEDGQITEAVTADDEAAKAARDVLARLP